MEYAYRLAPYKGKASRLTCPNCNRPHCFSPYVDDAGNVLDPTVGRCDHESSCAYHKTPADYFKEHPELREPDWRWQRPPQLQSTPKQRQITPAPAKPANYLPDDIVRRTLRLNPRSFLLQFLQTLFDEQTIVRLVNEYRIGVTKDLSAIFYQIDESGHCRAGKIIRYNPETGHRIKDASVPVDWVHTRLKKSGHLPESWQLTQCLFGQHLLRTRPDATVCLVEAEKTAVICAGFLPESLWLATCLYKAAQKNPPGHRLRTDYSDGDPDLEKSFYILKHTYCAAVLTENGFMDCEVSLKFLESEEGKKAIVALHVEGIIDYVSNFQ